MFIEVLKKYLSEHTDDKMRNEIAGLPKSFLSADYISTNGEVGKAIDSGTGHYMALYPLFTGLQDGERFQMGLYLFSISDSVD